MNTGVYPNLALALFLIEAEILNTVFCRESILVVGNKVGLKA